MNYERKLWTGAYLVGFAGYVLLAGHDVPAYENGPVSPIGVFLGLMPALVALQAAASGHTVGALSRVAAVWCLLGIALWEEWPTAVTNVLPALVVVDLVAAATMLLQRSEWVADGRLRRPRLVVGMISAPVAALIYPYIRWAVWVPPAKLIADPTAPTSTTSFLLVGVLILLIGVPILVLLGQRLRLSSESMPLEPFAVWERISYWAVPSVLCVLSVTLWPVLRDAYSGTSEPVPGKDLFHLYSIPPSILRRTVFLTRIGAGASIILSAAVLLKMGQTETGWQHTKYESRDKTQREAGATDPLESILQKARMLRASEAKADPHSVSKNKGK